MCLGGTGEQTGQGEHKREPQAEYKGQAFFLDSALCI